jgi:hypothetical protein
MAGVAVGAVSRLIVPRQPSQHIGADALRSTIADLQARLASQEARFGSRLDQLEGRVNEHEIRLSQVPSAPQIVSAMEELLSKTMAGIDSRLVTQARSIDVLKTTVSQTDELLERVLDSLDSLRQQSTTIVTSE